MPDRGLWIKNPSGARRQQCRLAISGSKHHPVRGGSHKANSRSLEQNHIRCAEAATMPTRGELEHGRPELIGSSPVTIERPGSRQKD